MSGYPALRVTEDDGSHGVTGGHAAWYGGPTEPPMVLARVADFRPVAAELVEDTTHAPPEDELASPEAPHWLATVKACQPRLVMAGLMLAAGLFGFAIGRWTSPEATEDPQAWSPTMPAPSAPEAPSWGTPPATAADSPVLGPYVAPSPNPTARASQSPEPRTESTPSPWGPPVAVPPMPEKAAGPMWGQTPPGGPELSTSRQTGTQGPMGAPISSPMPQWATNQGMRLPDAGSTGQPGVASQQGDPYAAARLAQRPAGPVQATSPPAQFTPPATSPQWQPTGQPPVPTGTSAPGPAGAPGDYRPRDWGTSNIGPSAQSGPPAAVSQGPAPSRGQMNTNTPSTGYWPGYPQTTQPQTY